VLNLGSLQFGIGVDTSGLAAAIGAVENFGRTVQGAQIAANRGFQTNISTLRQQENALLQGLERIASAQARLGNMRVDTSFATQLNEAYQQLSRTMTSGAGGLDPTKIDRARASFNGLVDVIMRDAQAANTAAASTEKYANSIVRAEEAARNLGQKIQTAPRTGNLGGAFSEQRNNLATQLDAALAAYRSGMATATASTAGQFQRQWTEAIGNVRRAFNELARPTPATAGWTTALSALGQASLLATGRLGGLSLQFYALRQVIAEHGAVIGVAAGATVGMITALTKLGTEATTTFIKMQAIEYGLNAVTRSAVSTHAEIEFLQKVANTAGLRFDDLAASYTKFYVAAKSANLSLAATHDVFQTVSQAAGVLHLQAENTGLAFLALEQMLSKGTVQTEELRRQLGDQLPGAFQIAAAAMGVTTAKLGDMLKKHEIAANVFLPKFAQALRDAYGLDLNRNVDTLQANLNRLHNSIFIFFNTLATSTGLGNGVSGVVKSISAAIDALTAHLPEAIGLLGGLAGAMTGLASVSAVTGIISMISAMGPFFALLMEAKTATEALTVATMGLNIVLGSSLIGVLIRVAAAIAGAVAGYELFSTLTRENQQASMDSLGALNNSIDGQRRLGVQIASTNQYIMEQIKLQYEQAKAAVGAATASLASLRAQGGPGIKDQLLSIAGDVGGAYRGVRGPTAQEVYNNRLRSGAADLNAAIQGVQQVGAVANNLASLKGLPQQVSGSVDDATKKLKEHKEGVQAAKNAWEKLVGELQDAQTAYNAVASAIQAGTRPNFDMIDALIQNRNQLRGMSDRELQLFAQRLGMAGASIDQIAQRMTDMEMPAIRMQKAIQLLHSSLDELRDAQQEIAGNTRMANFLSAGGDPTKAYNIEALNKASDLMAKFGEQGQQGADNLALFVQALRNAGYEGQNDLLIIQKYFAAIARSSQQVAALQEIAKAWKEIGVASTNAFQHLQAARTGNLEVDDWLGKLQSMRDQIEQFRQQQIQANTNPQTGAVDMQNVNDQVAQFAALNAQILIWNDQSAKTAKLWSDIHDVWNDAVHGMFDNIMAVADGTKSLGKAVEDFGKSVLNNFAQKALDVLSNAGWSALTGGNPAMQAAGIMGRGGPGAANAMAAQAVSQLAVAANIAATALGRIGMQMGMGVAAGGGGGIWGTLASAIGSVFGGSGISVAGATNFSNLAGGLNFGAIPARAMGGPGTKGWAYKVGEQGVDGEVFIPGTSGFFSKNLGGTNVTHIDASTHIDARGATTDAVEELKTQMAVRDKQLRQQLPFLIDARVIDSNKRLRTS
jgi:tape measure domain-containing protein